MTKKIKTLLEINFDVNVDLTNEDIEKLIKHAFTTWTVIYKGLSPPKNVEVTKIENL